MTAAQLARIEAMGSDPALFGLYKEDCAALTALLAERTALRNVVQAFIFAVEAEPLLRMHLQAEWAWSQLAAAARIVLGETK